MALLKMGPLATQIAGSIGGTIFMDSRYGQACRAKGWRREKCIRKFWAAYDENPIQGGFTDADIAEFCAEKGYKSRVWGSMTTAEQASWNQAASQFTWYNRLGDPYTPTGFLLFMQMSMNLQRTGRSVPATAPQFSGQPAGYDISIAQDQAGDLILGFNTLGNLDDYFILVYIYDKFPGFPIAPNHPDKIPSAKVMRRNSTRWLQVQPASAQDTFDITAYFTARYGTIPFGSSILFMTEFLDATTGQRFPGVTQYFDLVAP